MGAEESSRRMSCAVEQKEAMMVAGKFILTAGRQFLNRSIFLSPPIPLCVSSTEHVSPVREREKRSCEWPGAALFVDHVRNIILTILFGEVIL